MGGHAQTRHAQQTLRHMRTIRGRHARFLARQTPQELEPLPRLRHLGGTEYLHILLIVSWLNPKIPHRLTPAVSLNEHKTSNRSINLHNKYPRPPPPSQSRERSAKKVESFTLPRDSTMPSLRGRQLLCRVHRDIHPN